MINIIDRITGAESRKLNNQITDLQRRLNNALNENDTYELDQKKYTKRVNDITNLLEETGNINDALNEKIEQKQKEFETLKTKSEKVVEDNITLRAKVTLAEDEIKKATELIKKAEQSVFDSRQETASARADLEEKNLQINELLDTISRLEQKIKELSAPKNIKDKVNQMRRKHNNK